VARLWHEPTLHFFVVAAALLLGHRLVVGDPRTIALTPALKADLMRRYHDQLNRQPTPAEAEAFLAAWKTDEALYREALRQGIDREDPTVRSVLIGKMRERVMLGARVPEPTEAELQQYFAQHRDQFEAPLLYEHQIVAFPRSDPAAAQKRAQAERRLAAGATPASLGLPSTAANVTRARIAQDLGPQLADQICRLPIGAWHPLEAGDRLLLVKMDAIQGGPPPPDVLHARLVASWKGELQQKAMAQATRRIADRYHFEEPSR
jgi:PPIC-type PPIASE domain